MVLYFRGVSGNQREVELTISREQTTECCSELSERLLRRRRVA